MSIHKKPGKRGVSYQVKFRLPNGEQHSKTFRKQKDAVSFDNSQRFKKQIGLNIDVRLGMTTFGEVAKLWRELKDGEELDFKTLKRYDGILRNHILPNLGSTPINKIRHSDIQKLVNSWAKNGLSARSIYQHMQVLKPIFKLAEKDELIAKDPSKGIKTIGPNSVIRNPLSPKELHCLLDAIDPRFAFLVLFAYITGFRYGELESLNIGNFEFENAAVRVTKSKTESGLRLHPLTDAERDALTNYIISTGRDLSMKDEPLFITPRGKRLSYQNFHHRIWAPAVKKCGLPEVSIHDLRGSFGTQLSEAGVEPDLLAKLMGHSSPATSFKYYVKVSPEKIRSSAGLISARIAKGN